MIITRQHALRIIKAGKGKPESVIRTSTQYGDKLYVALTRYDVQRTDHYPAIYRDQVTEGLIEHEERIDGLLALIQEALPYVEHCENHTLMKRGLADKIRAELRKGTA